MIPVAFLALLAVQWFGGPEKHTREGAGHFESGRLEEALRAFSRAEGEFPDAPENDLNLAGVQYRMAEADGASGDPASSGPLAEALRGYQAALAAGVTGRVRRDALFNLANTLFRGGAHREAAAAYQEALALDPTDLEARQNLERALRRAEKDEQQSEEPQSGEQQSEEPQSGEQQSEEPQSGDQRSDQGGPDQQQEQQQDQQGQRDRQDRQNPPDPSSQPGERNEQETPSPGESSPEAGPGADAPSGGDPGAVPEISPEQAERILAALAEVERAFQEARLEERRARALRRGRH